ncbi:TldD/PmbA family protein [Saccharolobus islandicus]|uniref:Peptidase U62 modulator of DNA gyrase n=1 Tax=Saccharolobus islandicus (strain M.16.27) TaxID=427318 RepID=C3N4V9_SACI3|nr:TldD/PmbA family protein [Sulfolobus islandicus]ACP55034.1 peptidase U62 modulator of DNA gyrase [Sulfolobus islandicus M.16.27]
MTDLQSLYDKFRYPYVEVRRHIVSTFGMSFLNGRLMGSFRFTDDGYSVRYYKDGVLYFASSNNPNDLLSSNKEYKIEGWESGLDSTEPKEGSYEVKEGKPFDLMSVDEKISFFKNLYEAVKDFRSVRSVSFFYDESIEEKEIIVNGSHIVGRVPRLYVGMNLVLNENNRTATAFYELGGSGGLEVLERMNLNEVVVDKVRSVTEVLAKGKSFGERTTDVVLSNMLTGIMAHESVGHPFEADRVLGREFAQAGLSYLAELKDNRIGSDVITVIDDPTIPNSGGYYTIDDEGVEARPKYLIKDGKVNEYLQNRFSSSKFNVKSNGSARAANFDREPLIRMSNTFFKPGNMTFDELLEDVKEGVYIKSYMEWNIDDMRLGQRYVGLEAYEIKNGKIGDPVLFPVFQGKTTELLKAVDAVDNTLVFYPGTCGKGDPDQGIPVWLGGPNMRLRNVRIKVMGNE